MTPGAWTVIAAAAATTAGAAALAASTLTRGHRNRPGCLHRTIRAHAQIITIRARIASIKAARTVMELAAGRPPVPGPGPDDGKGCMTEDEFITFLAIWAACAQEPWNERGRA